MGIVYITFQITSGGREEVQKENSIYPIKNRKVKEESNVNKTCKITYQESVNILNGNWLSSLLKEKIKKKKRKDSIPIRTVTVKKTRK